jgi:hypothetical protein
MTHHHIQAFALPSYEGGSFSSRGPTDDYQIVDAEGAIAPFRDGPTMNFTGTIEEIWPQLLEINPNFESDYIDSMSVEKRTDFSNSKTLCSPPGFADAIAGDVADMIHAMRQVGGQPSLQGGPRVCARVSCKNKSLITWCNDVSATKHPPSL